MFKTNLKELKAKKYRKPRNGLASKALRNIDLQFVLNGYRNKNIAGLSKTEANSVLSLVDGPPCVTDNRLPS